ncbi:MAG: tRNA 2-thiocytidine(32) synthetase TtcA [Streptococcaceae bacterium]|jgi:tRNA(Ile)-lysidine synthase TilS/MesJ|nr:tRNA 2-thiocytidine(32) synthetase TtcA [Streptococcaceae bacterium]
MQYNEKDNARYFNPIRKAILNYQMIKLGDKVAVGISGGKDSISLFIFLHELKMHQRLGFDFELVPILLDMGLKVDTRPLEKLISKMGYTLTIVPTNIMQVIFDIRKERSPCSLCANLRRGILYSKAKELDCTKVAFGHHTDDALETYLMNFLLHGQMKSFEPKTYLTRSDITLIRPLLYISEKEIIHFAKRADLPIIANPCPVDKKTKREEMKNLVKQLEKDYPDIKSKFLKAMQQGDGQNFWQPSSL